MEHLHFIIILFIYLFCFATWFIFSLLNIFWISCFHFPRCLILKNPLWEVETIIINHYTCTFFLHFIFHHSLGSNLWLKRLSAISVWLFIALSPVCRLSCNGRQTGPTEARMGEGHPKQGTWQAQLVQTFVAGCNLDLWVKDWWLMVCDFVLVYW